MCTDIWKTSVTMFQVLKHLSKSYNCTTKVACPMHLTNPSHLPVTCQQDKQMLSGRNKQMSESWSTNKSMTANTEKEKMQICSPVADKELSLSLSVWQQTCQGKLQLDEAGTWKLSLRQRFRPLSVWERLFTFDFHIWFPHKGKGFLIIV